jgi:hypothetical protein
MTNDKMATATKKPDLKMQSLLQRDISSICGQRYHNLPSYRGVAVGVSRASTADLSSQLTIVAVVNEDEDERLSNTSSGVQFHTGPSYWDGSQSLSSVTMYKASTNVYGKQDSIDVKKIIALPELGGLSRKQCERAIRLALKNPERSLSDTVQQAVKEVPLGNNEVTMYTDKYRFDPGYSAYDWVGLQVRPSSENTNASSTGPSGPKAKTDAQKPNSQTNLDTQAHNPDIANMITAEMKKQMDAFNQKLETQLAAYQTAVTAQIDHKFEKATDRIFGLLDVISLAMGKVQDKLESVTAETKNEVNAEAAKAKQDLDAAVESLKVDLKDDLNQKYLHLANGRTEIMAQLKPLAMQEQVNRVAKEIKKEINRKDVQAQAAQNRWGPYRRDLQAAQGKKTQIKSDEEEDNKKNVIKNDEADETAEVADAQNLV